MKKTKTTEFKIKKIKKGDKVIVLLGKDRGKEGTVEKVLSKGARVYIAGINMVKRHIKGQNGAEGGIVEVIKPIDVSNAALICPNCKKVTRAGFEITKEGKKIRICRKCKKEIK